MKLPSASHLYGHSMGQDAALNRLENRDNQDEMDAYGERKVDIPHVTVPSTVSGQWEGDAEEDLQGNCGFMNSRYERD